MEGTVLGSPHFMSPEQVRGEDDIDIRTDIGALGATLYYALIGKPPYDGDQMMQIMYQHIEEPVPDVRTEKDSLSKYTAKIIETRMAKQAKSRYRHPKALAKRAG